jgi:hypothetical protein
MIPEVPPLSFLSIRFLRCYSRRYARSSILCSSMSCALWKISSELGFVANGARLRVVLVPK